MGRLNKVEQMNSKLLAYFDQLIRSKESRNDIPTQPEREDLYESKFDLFEHDNQAIQSLKRLMHQELKELIMIVNKYPGEIKESLKIHQHAWFHITHKNGYFTNHNHPMASWSAIYCVADGGRPDNYPESGITRFFHPNPCANYYMDAGNANLQGAFANGSMNFALATGDLVFFPSYLMHEVSVHKGSVPRVTIAANFWIDSSLVNVRI